jgi:hypothetical protein
MLSSPPNLHCARVSRVVVQIRFDDSDGERKPVAATTRRGGSGARVTLVVEREAVAAGAIHVLYRPGSHGLVVAGSVRAERVQAARDALGDAARSYRIARIPLDG